MPQAGWVTSGQDDPDVAVDELLAGRTGGRVVVDAGPLDVRPVPLRRGVVEGEGQPRGPREQRPDHFDQQASGDAVGPLAGGRDGDVAGRILVAELGRPDPGGDGPASPGQDGAEEQQGEPGGRPAVEGGGEPGEPLARGVCRMRGWHRGPAPLGVKWTPKSRPLNPIFKLWSRPSSAHLEPLPAS